MTQLIILGAKNKESFNRSVLVFKYKAPYIDYYLVGSLWNAAVGNRDQCV